MINYKEGLLTEAKKERRVDTSLAAYAGTQHHADD